MEKVWSGKIDEILKVGHQLSEIGLRNWALTKSQALFAVERFLEEQIPLLGGDVCENINGVIRPNYDSWHCDPIPNELNIDFLNRSILRARNYIETYPDRESERIFFALVPEV